MKKKRSNKKKGSDFEKKVQKTINSGQMWFDKGDLKTEDFVIDCKYTDKKSIRITKKMIKKLWNEALEANKFPLLQIGIQDEDKVWMLTVHIDKQ